MPVTNYMTFNGQLVGETGPNGTMYYHTDALGSVTMTTNSSGAVLNEYRYKPSGALLSKSGTSPDPKYMWVGSQGYRQTGLAHSDSYVRHRHVGSTEGRWTTRDRLWPGQRPYAYANGSPAQFTDSSGLFVGSGSFQLLKCAFGYSFDINLVRGVGGIPVGVSGGLTISICCTKEGASEWVTIYLGVLGIVFAVIGALLAIVLPTFVPGPISTYVVAAEAFLFAVISGVALIVLNICELLSSNNCVGFGVQSEFFIPLLPLSPPMVEAFRAPCLDCTCSAAGVGPIHDNARIRKQWTLTANPNRTPHC
jgi:RHS repeat-associated protein